MTVEQRSTNGKLLFILWCAARLRRAALPQKARNLRVIAPHLPSGICWTLNHDPGSIMTFSHLAVYARLLKLS